MRVDLMARPHKVSTTDRKQRVRVNGEFSCWAEVLSGIPQGCTWEQKAAMCVFQNFREIAFENFENCHAIFTPHVHARKIISGPINHKSSIFWQYEVKTALNVMLSGRAPKIVWSGDRYDPRWSSAAVSEWVNQKVQTYYIQELSMKSDTKLNIH